MNIARHSSRFATAALSLLLAACGGSDESAPGTPPAPPAPPAPSPPPSLPGTLIGAAGGTVLGPNGASAVIPAGALSSEVRIHIEQSAAGAPALPGGFSTAGLMFTFTPHGTTFAVPVTVALPFDPASVPAGTTPAFYKTINAQSQWEQVGNAVFGATSVSAQVTSFSLATVVIPPVVIPPLVRNDPVRDWLFTVYWSNGDELEVPGPDGKGTQAGGFLEKVGNFGPIAFDEEMNLLNGSVPEDGLASGVVFGTADGVTYGAFAEAPFGKLGGINQPGGPNPIGGFAQIVQRQSFVKRASDATLTYTLSVADICAYDYNLFPPTFGLTDDLTAIRGSVILTVQAWTTQAQRLFYGASGAATVRGTRDLWIHSIQNFSDGISQLLWDEESFQFTSEAFEDDFGFATEGCLTLRGSLTYAIDLSSIAIGEEFTVRSLAAADTVNRRGGGAVGDRQGSGVNAFLRDPLGIGGTTVAFAGLEPTNRPDQEPPVQAPVAPAACLPGPGPDPAAGVLQFSAANFTTDEYADAFPIISVSRTGGSRGAVTATFTTRDGTAIGGIDFTPVSTTVFFADGDTAPRTVRVDALPDSAVETDKTVNLELSQPGGCAALGTRTTAVLTIQDDDRPPPTGLPGALDPTFGTEGEARSDAFGGDRSAMALQADGKIVMVGGTFVDFILARFNADGSLDTTFDTDGKVVTDMVPGVQEESLGVAIQADGKIVVVGYAGVPTVPPQPAQFPNFALARYNVDGSLDATFGVGGKIVSGVVGQAYAVAIQPDGKIVVAGDFTFRAQSGGDFSDFALARYNPDGSLDATFSGDGKLTTDIAGSTNAVRNIVVQPNGAIVVSGKPLGSQAGFDHTDIARYNADGSLDASFAAGGKLTLAGRELEGGLALQSDGKLVLVGLLDTSVAPSVPGTVTEFALMRLNADGSPDAAFGDAGTAHTPITIGGRDSANAVALQADGRIVVAGSSSNVNRNFAVARYNVDGTLDTSFANLGKLTIDFLGFTDIAESVAIQPDGKIVVGGFSRGNVDAYGVARVLP